MQELFKDVRKEVKIAAEAAWNLASSLNTFQAARFLNTITNSCKSIYTEEEIEFLRFYFNLKMEMIQE